MQFDKTPTNAQILSLAEGVVITTIAQRDSRTGSSGSKSATPLTAKTKPCKVFRKGGADSRCVCVCVCVYAVFMGLDRLIATMMTQLDPSYEPCIDKKGCLTVRLVAMSRSSPMNTGTSPVISACRNAPPMSITAVLYVYVCVYVCVFSLKLATTIEILGQYYELFSRVLLTIEH